ncbi:MAG: exodeoxyribonuclease VII large subunit [Mangrovicoccus sp.]
MSDLIDYDDGPGDRPGNGPGNSPEFTVSELSGAVKRTVEGAFSFVRVRAEVGRVLHARSGHLYFDLKDDRAVLSAVSWKGQVSRLGVMPEEGLEVIATGKLTTFPGQSKYQMVVDSLAPAGVGALMAMLEKRKKALAAEGLFAPERKQPLPYLPQVIGVVTSPSGAVIRDILHRLRDRFPREVVIWPVTVQGKNCASEVARAIQGFNALTPGGPIPRPDVLIVARGGGSLEDLWGFNEEIVARAAAASEIPLISAVGHETDTTLIDFVSDQRAPTPSAAAEMAVPVRLDLLSAVENLGARLTRAAGQSVIGRQQRLADLSRALPQPQQLIQTARQRFDFAAARLPHALTGLVAQRRGELMRFGAAIHPSRLTGIQRQAHGRLSDQMARLTAGHRAALVRASRRLDQQTTRLPLAFTHRQAARQSGLSALSGRLSLRPAMAALSQGQRRLPEASTRLAAAWPTRRDAWASQLAGLERLRISLGYEATLKRGFAVVRDDKDAVLTSAAAAGKAKGLSLQFQDGRIDLDAAAPSPTEKPKRKAPSKAAAKSKQSPKGQASLFDD